MNNDNLEPITQKNTYNIRDMEASVMGMLQAQQEAMREQTIASLKETAALEEKIKLEKIANETQKEKIKYEQLHIAIHEKQSEMLMQLIEICQRLIINISDNNNRFVDMFDSTIKFLGTMTSMMSSNFSTEQKNTLEAMLESIKKTNNIVVNQSVSDDGIYKINTGDIKMGSNFNIGTINAENSTVADSITTTTTNHNTNSNQVVGNGTISVDNNNINNEELLNSLKELSLKLDDNASLKANIDNLATMVKQSAEKNEELSKESPLISIIKNVVETVGAIKKEVKPIIDTILKIVL